MINVSHYTLLGVVLFSSCTGCQKPEVSEVSEDLIQTTYGDCRIATQTIKQLIDPRNQSQLELETITINGEQLQVSTTQKSSYTYDAQGRILTEYNQRILTEYNQQAENKADSIYYQYSPTTITLRKVNLMTTPKSSSTEVIQINSQGFAEKRGYNLKVTYDNDGYFLTFEEEGTSPKISNGNIIESLFIDSPSTPS